MTHAPSGGSAHSCCVRRWGLRETPLHERQCWLICEIHILRWALQQVRCLPESSALISTPPLDHDTLLNQSAWFQLCKHPGSTVSAYENSYLPTFSTVGPVLIWKFSWWCDLRRGKVLTEQIIQSRTVLFLLVSDRVVGGAAVSFLYDRLHRMVCCFVSVHLSRVGPSFSLFFPGATAYRPVVLVLKLFSFLFFFSWKTLTDTK